jgi:hypothetical protein
MKLTFFNLFLLGFEKPILPLSHVSKFPSYRETFVATSKRCKLVKTKVYVEADSVEDDNTGESLSTILPKDDAIWKSEGEKIIRAAAVGCGAKSDQVNIRWLPGKIIVTLSGNTYLHAISDEGDDFLDTDYDEDETEMMEDVDDFDLALNANEVNQSMKSGIDVVSVARAINVALGEQGEGSLSYNIAFHHEIEVTTPGASDELQGIMFESYKGFDVLVESYDPKCKEKLIVVEGKLVERNDEQTVINVKGRLRKFRNELVQSVKLPKAKKEIGAK